jgi:hypothetical protein
MATREDFTLIPSQVTVEIDTRERLPLLFPANVTVWDGDRPKLVTVNTLRSTLNAGDYRLLEAPNLCVVERKGAASELYKNLLDSKDGARQARAFGRLRDSSRFPFLLVQMGASGLLTKTAHVPEPERMLQCLARCLARYGLQFLLVPQTSTSASLRVTGSLVLHLMIGYLLQSQDSTQCPARPPRID